MGDLKFLQILVSNVKITFKFKEEMFEEKYFMYDIYHKTRRTGSILLERSIISSNTMMVGSGNIWRYTIVFVTNKTGDS